MSSRTIKKARISLRTKIMIAFILVQVLVITAFSIPVLQGKTHIIEQNMQTSSVYFTNIFASAIKPDVLKGDYRSLRNHINELSLYRNIEYVFIMDEEGFVIASSDKNFEGKKLQNPLLQEKSPSERAIVYKTSDILDVSVPIIREEENRGIVRIGFSLKETNIKLRRTTYVIFFLCFLAIMVGAVIAAFLSWQITKALSSLINISGKIAEGDLTQQVNINTKDEFMVLAETFNYMTERLASYQNSLQELNEQLELKVKERTKALEESYRRLAEDMIEIKKLEEELENRYDELKREKHKLDDVVSSIGAALVLIGRDRSVIWANKVVTDINGGLDKIKGRHCNEISIGVKNITCGYLIDEVEKTGVTQQTILQGKDRNNEICYFAYMCTPIKDSKGQIVEYLEMFLDVTERKRLEEKLLHSERLAVIGKMSSQVAHEIRNPLSSISLNVELLLEEIENYKGVDTSEAKALISAMVSEIDRLAAVTEEYLQFARLPKPKLESLDLNNLIREMLDFLHGEFSLENIGIESYLDEKLPYIKADGKQLKQAFLNLIKNSVEAMPCGGKIRITTARLPNSVEIRVSDTGVGIDEKDLEKIFEPFYTTKDKGTGLGLSLTHQIVTEHGGSIRCETKKGEGTTFIINLPV